MSWIRRGVRDDRVQDHEFSTVVLQKSIKIAGEAAQ